MVETSKKFGFPIIRTIRKQNLKTFSIQAPTLNGQLQGFNLLRLNWECWVKANVFSFSLNGEPQIPLSWAWMC